MPNDIFKTNCNICIQLNLAFDSDIIVTDYFHFFQGSHKFKVFLVIFYFYNCLIILFFLFLLFLIFNFYLFFLFYFYFFYFRVEFNE